MKKMQLRNRTVIGKYKEKQEEISKWDDRNSVPLSSMKGGEKMPRKSREKDEYGIYYIRQQGSKEVPLFRDEKDRQAFLGILEDKKQRFGFKVYAYCIKQEEVYHLLIDANGSDISQVMKSMNISYALYRKSRESLFKDRYYSRLLSDHQAVKGVFEEIHQEGKHEKQGFNSYCFYNEEKLKASTLVDTEDLNVVLRCQDTFQKQENCLGCIESYEKAEETLYKELSKLNLEEKEFLKDKKLRNQKIWDYRKKTTLSLKELGRLFGGLSESSICKVLKSQDSNC
ncbi:transposase [Isachenkonia alkalipeptolytica]|uniref:Transposase n=1 Tax=Isachenkonia alkalipeptolytica TaxID=2565777 RepID=A0AA43XKL5_9CLOT|nr:transposase [Isachenkonia alkalipeptolytica]NBG88372.1 transposase [Isachenkonia alkalipeptolytica]